MLLASKHKGIEMRKLVVWSAEIKGDSFIYNIIAQTKAECLRRIQENTWNSYEPPKKKVIEYKDVFDLYDQATGDTPAHYR